MCGSMADIQSPTAEIRRGNKKKEEERNSMKIYKKDCTVLCNKKFKKQS